MQRFSRKDRVGEEIKKEIADILSKDVKDPRIGFISITDVEISDDLSYVKVFYSTIEEDKLEQTQIGLEKATGFIRTEIGKRIRLRVTPEIVFKYDDSLKRGARIMELLDEVSKKEIDEGDGDN
ncbi:MAG TPA: 30S ribosome-binding factor RbfA [Firmicutes bacterium]|jgi:ribosome-binding factor A|nr:30S ribosome-binding factor RbfA [Bacillota bacterium]